MRPANPEFTLNPASVEAIKRFRASKPWRGTFAERFDKFMSLRQGLAEANDVAPILEFRGVEDGRNQGNGVWVSELNTIILVGKLSFVTFLYCFICSCGIDRDNALKSARKIFRHYFPRSFGGCRQVGDCLVRDQAMRN